MALLDDLKVLIKKTIEDGDLDSTKQLLLAFVKTGQQADCDIMYFFALYNYLIKQYAMSMYWVNLCVNMFGKAECLTELLEAMSFKNEDGLVDCKKNDIVDITAFRRPLRILMYKGLIDIIDYTVDEFRKCYELLGHTVFVLDISDRNPNVMSEFIDIINGGIDFVQIFNNNGLKIHLEGKETEYLEFLGIRCYDYMFDHPMYFREINEHMPSNYILTCVDKNHNIYIDRFFPKICNFFMPLGSALGQEKGIKWEERHICALYVGSLKKHEIEEDDNLMSKIVDYLIENVESTTENAIEKCYTAYVNRNASEDEINKAIEKYHYVDMNVNYYFRKKLVETLVLAGIDTEVYGYGWNDVEFKNNPHFHYGGWISQNECLDLMQDTKFVLNSMPWFKDGIHDRVYNAMLAKSVCITDSSKYMNEHFKDKKDLLIYGLKSMENIPRLIHYYENNPEEARYIAENGYKKVIMEHTWQNRAMELLTHYFKEL